MINNIEYITTIEKELKSSSSKEKKPLILACMLSATIFAVIINKHYIHI